MKENAYLMVHGFGGGLDEVSYLVQYLQVRGLDVHSVLLAGHGSTKKALKKYSYTDWINSVKLVVDSLQKEYRHIHFLGFSMGGLLSVHFASMPETNSIVFINTPIYFWNIKIICKDIIHGIRHRQDEKLAYYLKSIGGTSVKSGIDFLKVLSTSKKMMSNIRKPTFIIQCMNDESVHHKSAEYIKNKIGCDAKLKYYHGGCHQIFCKSPELRDLVCDDIYQFLMGICNTQ